MSAAAPLDRPLPPWLDRLQRASLLLTAFLYAGGYATVGLLVMLVAVVLEGAVLRRIPWRTTPLDLPIAAFIGLFLLSGALSPYRVMAVSSTGLAALTIYLAFGLTARMVERDPHDVIRLCWAWVIGGGVTALVAMGLHFRTGAPASMPGLGQNAVGTTMVMTVVVALGLTLHARSRQRFLTGGIALLALAALLFTYTRGAWLGMVVSLVLLIGLGGRRAAQAGVLVALVVLGIIAGSGERSTLAVRARSIVMPSRHESRIYLLRSAVAIFADHPILGTGMNTFPLVYPRYRLPGDVNPPDARPNAHNIVFNTAAEGGVLGLTAFAALLVETFRLGWRWQARAEGATRGLGLALLAALAGMLVHQLFDGTLLSVHLGAGMWMLMAVLVSAPDPTT
ncbi:MAG: O-antigen ligase family protein [Armatimonadota bacterium]|nr:O-antigen ligase family protein [Armatimonadota bacterium]